MQNQCHQRKYHANCIWDADEIHVIVPAGFEKLESLEHEHLLLGIHLPFLKIKHTSSTQVDENQ